jgi:stage V sporulation protein B
MQTSTLYICYFSLKSFIFHKLFLGIFFSRSTYSETVNSMKKESVFLGASVLILTNGAVKVLSLIYRGVLIRLIGAEGLGLTELMSPFYSFLLVIASLGVPPAISNFISAERSAKGVADIVRTGTIVLVVSSSLVIAVTSLFFPIIAPLVFSDARVIPGFVTLVPTIFLISVFSSLRGFFQGSRLVSCIGKSQVVEQSIRVAAGIGIVVLLCSRNAPLPVILVGFAAASLLAESGGGIYLLCRYRKIPGKSSGTFRSGLAGKMIKTGVPITMSRLVLSVIPAIQAVLIPAALTSHGATAAEAASFFGLFIGVAVTVLHLPSVVTGALTTPLIPAIAAADSRGLTELRNRRIEKSIAYTYIVTVPILLLLFCFAEELCDILFASPEAGPMLALLSLGGIFIYVQQPIIAILQGMNRFGRLFCHYAVTGAVYLAGLFFLGRSDSFSLHWLILVFLSDDLLLFLINYLYLKKLTGFHVPILKNYLSPLLFAAVSFILMDFIQKQMTRIPVTDIAAVTVSACCFLFLYLSLLILFGVIDKALISSLLPRQKRR